MKMSPVTFQKHFAMGTCLGLLLVSGCGKSDKHSASAPSASLAAGDAHNHPTAGPHHGDLIELGNEEYHAELVHDQASGAVTIYLLDSGAKNAVPIGVSSLLVNVSHNGRAEQFTLQAVPAAEDPAGKCSRFVSTDTELAEQLDHEEFEAQLVAMIDQKQYRGAIRHDHEEHGEQHHQHDH
ncbi:MAG: hypothetical protein MI725_12795 [Pirellulales bacterium]|nr:hypothetical protein [Pirellulales bacterium]